MNIIGWDIVFQEVPDEISIAFTVVGCPLNCKGCHSQHLKTEEGLVLTEETYRELLNKYKDYATCVLFVGGEWYEQDLINFLSIAKEMGFKTCLYSGYSSVKNNILVWLDYVKVGPWVEKLGGLSSPATNQKFYAVEEGFKLKNITYKFWRDND